MKKPKKRQTKHSIIGMIYDFDQTLSVHNMQEDTIFKVYGLDSQQFWNKAGELVKQQGYERTLAYLKLLVHDEAFRNKPLTREQLKQMGPDVALYPGVETFFDLVDKYLASIPEVAEWGVKIEHYIVSSGLAAILEGMPLYSRFHRVYACEYEYGDNGPVFPKLVINDTNKTQFLFRINKGKLDLTEDINSHMPEDERRIPFKNMIYIGDSDTDIPSMTVIERCGGHAVGVYPPDGDVPEKVKKLIADKRASHFAPADYRNGSILTKVIFRTLKKIIHTIAYEGSAAMSDRWVKDHSGGQ